MKFTEFIHYCRYWVYDWLDEISVKNVMIKEKKICRAS